MKFQGYFHTGLETTVSFLCNDFNISVYYMIEAMLRFLQSSLILVCIVPRVDDY